MIDSILCRFTDFRVNEISLDGETARITSEELPRPKQEELISCTHQNVDSVVAAYQELYPDNIESVDHLKCFLNQLVNEPEKDVEPAVLKVCDDKKKRTQIHTIFRHCPFLPRVETKANHPDAEDGQIITVSKVGGPGNKKVVGNPGKKIVRNPWPGGKEHRYIKFIMKKINTDSNQALHLLSRTLHVPQKLFSVAGTKDKRAVTCQFVTGYQVQAERLQKLNDGFKGLLRFGNFEYCANSLGLGDLSGNEFEIVLRGLKGGRDGTLESDVSAAVESTRKHGFINYFGLQRFGIGDTPTHKVGEYLLLGKWKDAIESILSPGNMGNDHLQEALNVFKRDGDAKIALEIIPRKFGIQKTILEYLSKHGNNEKNYPSALLDLPKTSRNLYIHAFHSYVWNNVVSERIKEHGVGKILPGDLVLPRQLDGDTLKQVGKRKRESPRASLPEPHVVTEDDIIANTYGFEDVVMPLPGSSVMYPQNSCAAYYDPYTSQVDKGSFHNVRQFQYSSFTGDYRHILFRPEDLEYKIYRYDDLDEEIPCFTDMDQTHEGSFLSLALKFTLPSSTYATMLIREVTKMPTDVGFAKTLDHSAASQH